MKHLPLFPGAPPTSALGFGTTSLMGTNTSKERLALLEVAFDAGICHFDTAPYYGYGESERILGEFLVGKREQVTLTTKFGIQAPSLVKSRMINLLARRILKLLPSLRKALSQGAQSISKRGIFNPVEARKSLDQSLTSLKTDHVDLFLLHEPTFDDARSEELQKFLEDEVRRGRILAYGCGGEFSAIQSIANAKLPTSHWLQFEDNVLNSNIETIRPCGARCITYRTFHQALMDLTSWLGAEPIRYAEWGQQLQVGLREDGVLAGLMQAASHFRNPDGIVLFSTRRADRIRSAARIASGDAFSREQLQKFIELIRTIPVQLGVAR